MPRVTDWHPVEDMPPADGPYLVLMPARSSIAHLWQRYKFYTFRSASKSDLTSLDRWSVRHWDHIEGSFSNDFGISHWMELPEEP